MKNKRGLSQIVTTVILILLIIMAIAGIWIVVDRVILQGTSKINIEQFTIDLKIVSAKINYSSGTAEVRVKRNQGEGNLTAIKFIVEDPRTSEVFEERFDRFEELAEKTFILDLLITGSDLILTEIDKISIAPVYTIGSSTSEKLGSITDSIEGIKDLNVTADEGEEDEGTQTGEECLTDGECGTDYFIEGTKVCNELNDAILQYKKIHICSIGFCDEQNVLTVVESCPTGTSCFEDSSGATCQTEPISCTEETVQEKCGYDDWIGSLGCQTNPEAIVQNFKTYSCNEGFCESSTSPIIKEECLGEEICYDGACVESLECTQNSDCGLGEVCKEGICETEVALNTGTIYSIWPFGIAEYFDSFDLPQESATVSAGHYIIFPESLQISCLQIGEFSTPDFEGGISYIRLNTAPTNISDGDNYEIWETDYICSTL